VHARTTNVIYGNGRQGTRIRVNRFRLNVMSHIHGIETESIGSWFNVEIVWGTEVEVGVE
jgi:hypothetical protein